jgi:hypothetical protein
MSFTIFFLVQLNSNVASYAQNYVNQLGGSFQLVHSGGQLIEINLILVTAKLFNQVAASTFILLVGCSPNTKVEIMKLISPTLLNGIKFQL